MRSLGLGVCKAVNDEFRRFDFLESNPRVRLLPPLDWATQVVRHFGLDGSQKLLNLAPHSFVAARAMPQVRVGGSDFKQDCLLRRPSLNGWM